MYPSCKKHQESTTSLQSSVWSEDTSSQSQNWRLGFGEISARGEWQTEKTLTSLAWTISCNKRNDPDVTVVKVYFPEEGTIQVHQSRVCSCPPRLPAGFYWYGGQRKSSGRLPPWLAKLFQETEESEMPEQTENVSEDLAESDLESNISDDDKPTEEQPVDEPPSESSPTTNNRYPLRNRAGGVTPRLLYVRSGRSLKKGRVM